MDHTTKVSEDPGNHSEEIPTAQLAISMALAPLSSFSIVLILTNVINLISRQEFDEPIIWPQLVFIGAILGGSLGALIAYWEIRISQKNNQSMRPGKILSIDLAYIFGLAGLIYLLEIISESLILQGLLFLCEIAWFTVLGLNISKVTFEIPSKGNESKKDPENEKIEN